MCEIVVIAVAVANMLPGEAQDRWLGIGPARKKYGNSRKPMPALAEHLIDTVLTGSFTEGTVRNKVWENLKEKWQSSLQRLPVWHSLRRSSSSRRELTSS